MARWWWIPFLERQEQTTPCSQKVWDLNSKISKSQLFCFCSARDRVQLCSAAISAWHLHRHSSRLPGDFPLVVKRSLLCLQPFYMCEENGRSTAFLCPNGTIFNQQYFVCDWWILNDCLKPLGQPKNFQVVQHWLRSPAGLLQLEPVHLWWARRGWVHPYPSLIIPIFLWRPTMQLSLLYRWLAEAGKCCCVCR